MVAVAQDPNPNAYLVNLSSILITSGLTTLINSGEQLAFVLAHEIAHGMIERCTVNEETHTSRSDCQRFINTGALRTEATLIPYTDTSHELKADRIAVSIMKDLPFEGNQAAQLLSRISELQIKQGQRISKQMQSRINALQAVDFQQNLLYF